MYLSFTLTLSLIMEPIHFQRASGSVYCTIRYDEREQCLCDSWDGKFGTQDNFQKVIQKTADLITQNKITKLLSDQSRMEGSYDGSNQWIEQEIIPVVIKHLKRHAIVLPKNIFANLSAKDYVKQQGKYEVRLFGSVEDARKWIA
ncbi:STAS/SEC14 domain-containing protein [Xanthocytophaga agilis]|uniref:STAS/SEC14 domain-containing protein n=1 Tax=Xanthocytophaga agilis TaxID=3048010 RepID=A0AAE3UCF4_9BACT|nr:hypothetical protein [Xanthocytophaga agilis]MDJ1500055.1 hypothetical protein [Xanthocytophaga agilis]